MRSTMIVIGNFPRTKNPYSSLRSIDGAKRRERTGMQKRRLSLGGNSVIPAIVNGVSKLCGLAKAALAEGAGTAPIVRAVSCYETRRASQRDREVHPSEEPRAKDFSECKEDRRWQSRESRESQPGGGQTGRPRLFPPRSFPSVSLRSSRGVLVFSFFCCFPSRGSCHAGDRAESKPPMCLARPPAVGLLPRGLCPLLFSSTTIFLPSLSSSFSFPFIPSRFHQRWCPLRRCRLQRGSDWAHIDLRSSRVFVRGSLSPESMTELLKILENLHPSRSQKIHVCREDSVDARVFRFENSSS